MEKITIEKNEYLSIDDFAKYKGISRKTVYNMIKDKRVKVKRILNRQFIKIN
jgi:excisionase family DNA binding protein